jgi:hypothetical protein
MDHAKNASRPMYRQAVEFVIRKLLGPIANAGRLVLDRDARLVLSPRLQKENAASGIPSLESRQYRHLRVYEGGSVKGAHTGVGPLGRPIAVPPQRPQSRPETKAS